MMSYGSNFFENRLQRSLVGVLLGCALQVANSAQSAELTGVPGENLSVVKGDRITLQVGVSGETPSIYWWSEGRVICQSDQCAVDTTGFSPGQAVIDVVIEDSQGVTLTQVKISATDAPPLYRPKNVLPDLVAPATKPTSIPKGQWIIIEREGGVSHVHPSRPKQISQCAPFSAVSEAEIYSVSAGGAAIVRRVGEAEQVLLSPQSKFVVRNGRFELLSGRALWRVSTDLQTSKSQLSVAGGQVDATGPSLVGIEVGFLTKNEMRAILQNFQSSGLRATCKANEQPKDISTGRAAMFVLNSESMCTRVDAEDFRVDDCSVWVSRWSPWWFTNQMSSPVDRWRSDYLLFSDNRPIAERLKEAESFRSQSNCANALDLLSIRQVSDKSSQERLKLVASCQFDLGMYGKALGSLDGLEGMKVDPSWTAFMTAKTYQNLQRHDLALHWFNEAYSRGHRPVSGLGRLALESAEARSDGLEKLKWLEVIWLSDDNQTKKDSNQDAYRYWRENRPIGGEVTGAVFMDSQAVPLNSKTTSERPIVLKASRATVASIAGLWWTEKELTKLSGVRIHGEHSFSSPTDAKLSFASSSLNTLGADFKFGDFDWRNLESSDRWNFLVGARLGIGISGGESQRDQYGYAIKLFRPSWAGFSLALESNKFFDPKPGGEDIFSLDMERYTGQVDHSHIDMKFKFGFQSKLENLRWSLSLGTGSSDYRTSDMESFDHSISEVFGQVDWIQSPRINIGMEISAVNRSFKLGGSDLIQKVTSVAGIRIFSLWRALIQVGLEKRDVSKDPLSSWTRHIYGVAIQTDL